MSFNKKVILTSAELLFLYFIVLIYPIIFYFKDCYVYVRDMKFDMCYGLDKYASQIITFIALCLLIFLSIKTSKYFLNIYRENQVRFNQANLSDEEDNNMRVLLFEISFIFSPIGCFIFMIILKLIRVFGFDSLRYPKLHFINIKYFVIFANICYFIPIITVAGFFNVLLDLNLKYNNPFNIFLEFLKLIM